MDRAFLSFIVVAAFSWPSLCADPTPIPNPVPDPAPGGPIQAICAKAPKPDDCIAKTNADPRTELKSTPEGIATILFDQAKQSVEPTIKLIKDSLPSVTDPEAKDLMDGCLSAYKKVGKKMKLKTEKLKKPSGRSAAVDSMNTAEQEISYDCEWEEVKVRPPELNAVIEKVQDFSNSLDAATSILAAP